MTRARFTERQVIEALIRTGHVIQDYRTNEAITLENVGRLEREHIIPLALGGADDPSNAGYTLKENHAIQTNGTKATSYGSDKHAIAKVKRLRGERKGRPKKAWPKGKKLQSRGFQKRGNNAHKS